MVPYSYPIALLVLVASLALPGHASQEEDSDKQSLKRSVPDAAEESSKRQKLELIEELKQMRRDAVNGQLPWIEVLREEKRAIANKQVTEIDLGIQSRTCFLSPLEVQALPLEKQYEALLKVQPDDLQFIPEMMRKEALEHHLKVMGGDPSEDELHALRARLGLITFPYTESQEMALFVMIPKIDEDLKPLKTQLNKILHIRPLLESQKEVLTKLQNKSPADEAKLKQISQRLEKLALEEKDIERQRRLLAREQKGHIRKVTREYFTPRPVIRVSSDLDEYSTVEEEPKEDEIKENELKEDEGAAN